MSATVSNAAELLNQLRRSPVGERLDRLRAHGPDARHGGRRLLIAPNVLPDPGRLRGRKVSGGIVDQLLVGHAGLAHLGYAFNDLSCGGPGGDR